MGTLSADLAFRGLVHQVSEPGVVARLDAGGIVTYGGFDPTAPSLHVGHLVPISMLRRVQLSGNPPIVVAGGGTGLIGDPGGKTSERSVLSREEVDANLAGVRPQLELLLDFSPGAGSARAALVDNAEWLAGIAMVDFLRDVGKHFTVNQMVAKESVRSRFERAGQGISFTEFSYMLLQAYDFLRLHVDRGCTLQIGGSEQWGNITMGIELVRKATGHEVHGLTLPLLLKADGTKFGKTESGTVWLDARLTSPYRFYQYFVQVEDAVVGTLLRRLTFLSHEEILELEREVAERPERRAAQRALARAVATMVHGESEAARAERASAALFGEAIAGLDERTLLEVVDEAPSSSLPRSILDGDGPSAPTLVDLLVDAGLTRSKSEARRAVAQGGVYVNNVRASDADHILSSRDLLHDRYVVLRRGRRDYHLLRLE
ncbi:MAG TPA: tyrosine--tRNA ligase [Acidimicrobiales bacterium]|jgi:tyrosyl-tRNA synthetase